MKAKQTTHVIFQIGCTNEDNAETTNVSQKPEGTDHHMLIRIKEICDPSFQKLKAIVGDPGLFTWPEEEILSVVSKYGPISVWFYRLCSSVITIFVGSLKKDPKKTAPEDIVHVDDVHDEYQELSDILQGKGMYGKLKAELPNGVLLYGPPGAGKSTFANQLAQETGVAFFPVSGRDLAKGDPSMIIKIFKQARACGKALIFISGIDDIARKQEYPGFNPHLSQLHTEFEKCKESESVVLVIAATTSSPKTLDLALYYGGKFFKEVQMDKPDEKSRQKFAALQLGGVLKEDKEAICNYIASETQNLDWADLKNITAEIIRLVGRRGADHVIMEDVLKALKRVKPEIQDDKIDFMAQEQVKLMVESAGLDSTS